MERHAARRSADGRGDLRQVVHPHPRLVRRRHRRPGRQPADHLHREQPARRQGDPERHRQSARADGRGHRLAHLRAGGTGGDGGRYDRAGDQRPLRRLPPVPAPRRSADDPRGEGPSRRTDRRLPGRRRQQHGAVLPARGRHGRPARAGREPRGLRAVVGRAGGCRGEGRADGRLRRARRRPRRGGRGR